MKERYAQSSMRKQTNRMTFGEVSALILHTHLSKSTKWFGILVPGSKESTGFDFMGYIDSQSCDGFCIVEKCLKVQIKLFSMKVVEAVMFESRNKVI